MLLFVPSGFDSDEEFADSDSNIFYQTRSNKGKSYNALPGDDPEGGSTDDRTKCSSDPGTHKPYVPPSDPQAVRPGMCRHMQQKYRQANNKPPFHSYSSTIPNSRYKSTSLPQHPQPRNSSPYSQTCEQESPASQNGRQSPSGAVTRTQANSTVGYQSDGAGGVLRSGSMVGYQGSMDSVSSQGSQHSQGSRGSQDGKGGNITQTKQYQEYQEETYHRPHREYHKKYRSDEVLRQTEYHDDTDSGDTEDGEEHRRPSAYIRRKEGGIYMFCLSLAVRCVHWVAWGC